MADRLARQSVPPSGETAEGMKLIYLDNAATTLMKPPEVAEAVAEALRAFGGVGRGVHEASLAAGAAVYRARATVGRLLGAPSAARVAFGANATEALNTALAGLLRPGDHAITTAASHNSVLRPLYRLREAGVGLSIAPIGPDGSLDYDALEALFRPETRVLAVTHASNLTGDVYDAARLARIAHSHGALLVLDAAQTAGSHPLDQGAMGLDVVAFTGHKSLFGPQGTGGLCVAEGVDIAPLSVGGSGMRSFDETHPAQMPERLEAGTPNAHGLAGLAAGAAFVERTGVEAIAARDRALAARFEAGARILPGVRVLGGGGDERGAIVALNVADADASLVSDRLAREWGICTRAGAHCAPLMHRALGTEGQGAVRFSFSFFNAEDEVDAALAALERIAFDVEREGA